MKSVIKRIDEISDSKEMLEANPFNPGVFLLYLLVLVLFVGVIWASISNYDIVVKSSCIVRPFETESTLVPNVSGYIDELNYLNGDEVRKGETIIRITDPEFIIELDKITDNITIQENQLKELELFHNEIINGSDKLTIKGNYASRYRYYLKELVANFENIQFLKYKKNKITSNIIAINDYIESITNNIDIFTEITRNNKYYTAYQVFSLKNKELSNLIRIQNDKYKTTYELYENGVTKKMLLDEEENNLRKLESDFVLHTESKKLDLINEKNNYENELVQINGELVKLAGSNNDDINYDEYRRFFNIDIIYELDNEMRSLKKSISTFEIEANRLKQIIDLGNIKSPIDGYFNLGRQITEGDYINKSQVIGTIIPVNSESFKVQLMVSNKDINNIKLNADVKVRFEALPYQEFGYLEGQISRISKDVSLTTSAYGNYIVEATIPNSYLVSKKGEDAELKVGMQGEAQVVVKTKKVIVYVLEKLDFWN